MTHNIRSVERKIALCYVRKATPSWYRVEEDANNPEHQRENLQRMCERKGWISEWYEDIGQNSGSSEENRPQWQALLERVSDPNVVALVVDDIARISRKPSILSLITAQLNSYGVLFAIASIDKNLE
jgi:DNA invertase Pin-like site-specific DNA recombinase